MESYLRQALVEPGPMAELLPAMSGLFPVGITSSLEAALRWDGSGLRPTGTPTLVLRGALDKRVTEPAARALAEALGGRFEQIPGAGHLAYVDRPRQFGATLAAFHRSFTSRPGRPVPVDQVPRPHWTAPEPGLHRKKV